MIAGSSDFPQAWTKTGFSTRNQVQTQEFSPRVGIALAGGRKRPRQRLLDGENVSLAEAIAGNLNATFRLYQKERG